MRLKRSIQVPVSREIVQTEVKGFWKSEEGHAIDTFRPDRVALLVSPQRDSHTKDQENSYMCLLILKKGLDYITL